MKKIFVLDCESERMIKQNLEIEAENKGLEIKVDVSGGNGLLLKDYDVYILHLSETTLEAIDLIYRQQPDSKFFAISGGNISRKLKVDYPYLIDTGERDFSYKKVIRNLKNAKL